MGLLDFQITYKIAFIVRLKQSSFWPSADVKPMQNDLVHAMPGSACLLSLYKYLYGCIAQGGQGK